MPRSKTSAADKLPATKGDLKRVEAKLSVDVGSLRIEVDGIDQRLIGVESDVSDLKKDLKSTKKSVEYILEVVKTIDKNTRGLPAQVKRLNQRVFGRH